MHEVGSIMHTNADWGKTDLMSPKPMFIEKVKTDSNHKVSTVSAMFYEKIPV